MDPCVGLSVVAWLGWCICVFDGVDGLRWSRFWWVWVRECGWFGGVGKLPFSVLNRCGCFFQIICYIKLKWKIIVKILKIYITIEN